MLASAQVTCLVANVGTAPKICVGDKYANIAQTFCLRHRRIFYQTVRLASVAYCLRWK